MKLALILEPNAKCESEAFQSLTNENKINKQGAGQTVCVEAVNELVTLYNT